MQQPRVNGSRARPNDRPTHFVQSLERGFAVVRAFSAERPEMTVTEVAQHCGLDRAAVRRFLLTLVDLGYVKTDGKVYSLRPRILELGYAYLSSLSLPEIARPHMEHLVQEIHETCSLGVLDESEVVFVARVATRRLLTVPIMVGSHFPAYATSMGRVLLADQPDDVLEKFVASQTMAALTPNTVTDPAQVTEIIRRVRDTGFAIVDKEMDEVTISMAVPVRGSDGRAVAALNVSTLSASRSVDEVRGYLPALQAAVRAIEADLKPSPAHSHTAR